MSLAKSHHNAVAHIERREFLESRTFAAVFFERKDVFSADPTPLIHSGMFERSKRGGALRLPEGVTLDEARAAWRARQALTSVTVAGLDTSMTRTSRFIIHNEISDIVDPNELAKIFAKNLKWLP